MRSSSRAAFCLIGSAAVHVGLVAALVQAQGGRSASPVQPRLFQVRLVTPGMEPATDGAARRPERMSSAASGVERQLADFAPARAPSPSVPVLPPLERIEPVAVPGAGPTSRPVLVHYYLPSELNERPRLVEEADPNLHVPVGDVQVQDLVVRLMINRDGTIDDVVIEDVQTDARVTQAVVLAFKGLKFVPGKLDGDAVNSQIRIQVHLDTGPEIISRTVVH